ERRRGRHPQRTHAARRARLFGESMTVRHFLTLNDCTPSELTRLLARAIELKQQHKQGALSQVLAGKTVAMIFEKSSTRTRVSFEAGVAQLGGSTLFLSPRDMHLDRGEPVEDTA